MTPKLTSLLAFVAFLAIGFAPCIGSRDKASAADIGPLGEQGLSQSEVDAIRQTILSWTDALAANDLARWDSFWAKDSILMPPGRDWITDKTKLNAIVETPPYDDIEKVTFSDWAIAGRGDLAVVVNNIQIKPKSDGVPTLAKQLIVLRRHDSGRWLVQAVMFNSLKPAE